MLKVVDASHTVLGESLIPAWAASSGYVPHRITGIKFLTHQKFYTSNTAWNIPCPGGPSRRHNIQNPRSWQACPLQHHLVLDTLFKYLIHVIVDSSNDFSKEQFLHNSSLHLLLSKKTTYILFCHVKRIEGKQYSTTTYTLFMYKRNQKNTTDSTGFKNRVFSNKYFSRNFFNHPTIRFCIFNAFTSHCNKMFQSIKYRFSSCWARRRTAKIITIVGLFVCIWKMIRSLVI